MQESIRHKATQEIVIQGQDWFSLFLEAPTLCHFEAISLHAISPFGQGGSSMKAPL